MAVTAAAAFNQPSGYYKAKNDGNGGAA